MFTLIYKKFERGLYAINHATDAKNIQKLVNEKCGKFQLSKSVPENARVTFELSKDIEENGFKIECIFSTANEYIKSSSNDNFKQIWQKYKENLFQIVDTFKKCQHK